MTIEQKTEEFLKEYEAVMSDETLTEDVLPGRFADLAQRLSDISAMLSEAMAERMVALLDAELEAELEKALAEVDVILAEPEKPSGILESFISEAPGLSQYRRETDLTKIFAKTIGLLEISTARDPNTNYIRMFVDLKSSMDERRLQIPSLIAAHNNGEEKSEAEKALLLGVVAYAEGKSNKKSMQALAKAVQL